LLRKLQINFVGYVFDTCCTFKAFHSITVALIKHYHSRTQQHKSREHRVRKPQKNGGLRGRRIIDSSHTPTLVPSTSSATLHKVD